MLRWKNPVKQRQENLWKIHGFFFFNQKRSGSKICEKKNQINPNQPRPHSQYHPFQHHSSWMFTPLFRCFFGDWGDPSSCKNIGKQIHPKINHGPPLQNFMRSPSDKSWGITQFFENPFVKNLQTIYRYRNKEWWVLKCFLSLRLGVNFWTVWVSAFSKASDS